MAALRVGIVGCGPRGLDHARGIAGTDGLELAGFADRGLDARRRATDEFGGAAFESLEVLLSSATPEIVVLATQPDDQADLVVEAALDAGVRAIVAEKPLAHDLATAERLVEACEREGVLLAVSHQTRYARPFVRVKELIEAGDLGRIETINAVSYGGLLHQGTHQVDAMRWLTGSEVAWVMSQAEPDPAALRPHLGSGDREWSDENDPSPPWSTHHLGFENGVRATMEVGSIYQRSEPYVDDWLQRRIAVVGTDGTAEARVSGHLRVTARRVREDAEDEIESVIHSTFALHADVRDAVRDDRQPRATGRDALEALRVLLACLESASSGGIVSPETPSANAATPEGT